MKHWQGVVAVEGAVSGDGRLVDPGALTWETPLPLMRGGTDNGERREEQIGNPILGTVQTIERFPQADGRTFLWGTGDLFGDPPENLDLSASCTSVEHGAEQRPGEVFETIIAFTAAQVRAVYVGSPAIWPECVMQVPDDEDHPTAPTGGFIPPFITDRIPGHEDDQP